ncbi:MAG: hypothetical protein UD286_03315 [Bacteroidales bacterium]|nr:hypothetical protein [Bacteroidales bacterium]
MKKLSLFLGMALAASLSLTNCTEKIEGPIAPATPAGIPFEISADISTKTTNDGLATQWAEGDAINLFHAEAGKTDYVSDNDFTLDATRVGVFTGNLSSALAPSTSYDWYAIYPYNQALETPANNATTAKYFYVGGRSDTPAVQNGNNSTSHLVERYAPLWGKAANVPSNEQPSMMMQHLASVVKVKVTNTTEKPLTVNSVAFTSTEPIVGQFYIDVTGTAVEYTTGDGLFNSSTASLTVKGATPLAKGESAVYYIPIKPHTVAAGKTLKISVNGYEKPLTLPTDVTFTAGSIKTLAFNFDKVVVDYVTIPWAEDFSGDLSLYELVNGGSDTKTYEDNLAGGTAPELLISKQGGSFSAKVKADAGNYVLTFTSNHADYLTVLSSDKNVTVTKESNTKYLFTVPEGGSTFTLTIKNTRTGKSDNARIDDISLVADTAVKVPVITVDKTTVSAKPEGDKLTLKYSIKYPAADATITATSKETWVKGFDYKVPGEVSFVVDANEGGARTATVTLFYPGAAPVAVTVSQSAKGAVTEPIVFGNDWNTLFGTKYSGSFNLKADALSLNGSVNGVSIKVTNGTSTNGYIKTNDFRAYKGYTITFTAPEGSTIKSIVSTKGGKTFTSGIKADSGNLSIKNNAISWTGDKQIVKLTISGTVSFATITITL